MRKIEKEMIAAIAARNNWHDDNTQVFIDSGTCAVWLHGNCIATVWQNGETEVNIDTLREWPTNTTLSRLRALGVNVCRKNFVVHLNGQPV